MNLLKNNFLKTITRSDFQKLWVSQLLSQVTLNLLNFVIILRIFEETGSSLAVSLVWLFYAVPVILLGPISGGLVDLFSRRKILTLVNFIQAIVVLFYLPIQDSIWPIYTVVFIYSLLNQLFIPAEAASVPSSVPKSLYPTANTLFLFTIYGSFLIGFGLAGPLVDFVGERTPFVLGSAMLFFAGVTVSQLSKKVDVAQRANHKSLRAFIDRLFEGYEFIKEKPLVLMPIILLALSQILVTIVGILTPAIASNVLNIRLVDSSFFLILPVGAGAIFGALTSVALVRRIRKKRIVSFGIFLAAVAFLWFSLVVPNVGHKIGMASLNAFVIGYAFTLTVIPVQTLIQEQTPKAFRGRVFGVLTFAITSASLLPVLFAATIAEFFGVLALFSFLGFMLLVLGVGFINSEGLLARGRILRRDYV